MKNFLFFSLIVCSVSFYSHLSSALVELKIHGGISQVDPDLGAAFKDDISSIPGYGLDAVVNLPMVPLGFGLRYEQMGEDVSSIVPNQDFDVRMKRVSLLINKRLIDTILIVGIVGSIGITHDNTVKIGSIINESPSNEPTYSLGVEVGAKLLGFLVSGEIGYLKFKLKDAGALPKAYDFSGTYIKAMVGFGF